jgi:hypothetical protein
MASFTESAGLLRVIPCKEPWVAAARPSIRMVEGEVAGARAGPWGA